MAARKKGAAKRGSTARELVREHPEEAMDLLISLLERDPSMLAEFVTSVGARLTAKGAKSFCRHIVDLTRKHGALDRDDCELYSGRNRLAKTKYHKEMKRIVAEIKAMAEIGDRVGVLDAGQCIVDQVDMECDPNVTPCADWVEGALDAWSILAQGTPAEEKESLLREMGRRIREDENLLGSSVMLAPLLVDDFADAQLRVPLREVMLELLDTAYKVYEAPGASHGYGLFPIWADACIGVLEDGPDPLQAVGDLARKYWSSRNMRLVYVDWLMRTGHPEEALAALDENDALDPQRSASPAGDNGKRRRQILKALGRETENRDPLWQILLDRSRWGHPPMDVYRELKSTYTPEEWAKEAPRAYALYKDSSSLGDLYQEDGQIGPLAEIVSKTNSLSVVYRYEQALIPDHASMLVDKYEELILKEARRASMRRDYANLAHELGWLAEVPGGRERAAEIISRLLDEYPRKPALREELSLVRI